MASPTSQVSVEVISDGGCRRGRAAGMNSVASPTPGLWVQAQVLILGQPWQSPCPLSLDTAICGHFNPNSCTLLRLERLGIAVLLDKAGESFPSCCQDFPEHSVLHVFSSPAIRS